ncbi:MAG: acyl carrier protein [Elusimicrobia bacterium]|nr:acyl carrier protein [Elusimicrobiota bacterium]
MSQDIQKPIEPPIRDFIARNLLYLSGGFDMSDDDSLVTGGVIDSLGVTQLVGFVQREFGFKVEQHDIRPENFDSIAKLAAFVRRKAIL